MTKIVKVGAGGEALLEDITRFTNSQNAVREQDFLALSGDMRSWAAELAARYNVFLEIQRGGWDSRRAWQKQHPDEHVYERWANAFDLLKIYGAGWLGEAGLAFGKNPPFLPGGAVFKRITETPDATGGFGAEDLYCALQLSEVATSYRFGRSAERASRRQTRFLFSLIVLDMLRDVLIRASMPSQPRPADLTVALRALFDASDGAARESLFAASIDALDEYMADGTEDSVFSEPSFKDAFNSDLNAFLKSEQLGKNDVSTPRLRSLLAATKRTLGRPTRSGEASPRDQITQTIRGALQARK